MTCKKGTGALASVMSQQLDKIAGQCAAESGPRAPHTHLEFPIGVKAMGASESEGSCVRVFLFLLIPSTPPSEMTRYIRFSSPSSRESSLPAAGVDAPYLGAPIGPLKDTCWETLAEEEMAGVSKTLVGNRVGPIGGLRVSSQLAKKP